MTSEINVNHSKKISQDFIDEYNLLLDSKSDKNKNVTNKTKIFNNNFLNKEALNNNINKKNSLNKYFSYNKNQKISSKEEIDINNKSLKNKNKISNEKSNIKKISKITSCHKKSRTFFILHSYVIKNISNQNYNNNINNINNNTNDNSNALEKINKNILKENKTKGNFNTTIPHKNKVLIAKI